MWTTPWLSAIVIALSAPVTPVLGVDAAPKLLSWVKSLKGLDVSSVPIEKDRAKVKLSERCELLVTHPRSKTCEPAIELGGARGCWQGDRCPSEARRKRALTAAGPLTLPWRIPAGDHMASGESGADAARQALIAARKKAAERLDVMDRAGAKAALLPLLRKDDLGAQDLLSVMPVLVFSGGGEQAFEFVQRPEWSSPPLGERVHVR